MGGMCGYIKRVSHYYPIAFTIFWVELFVQFFDFFEFVPLAMSVNKVCLSQWWRQKF